MHRLSVKEGRLVLPDGVRYRYLVMPPTRDTIDPASLRRIKTLIEEGATVVLGPRPVSAAGLGNYPQCDAEIKELADAIWGMEKSTSHGQRTLGKGRVVWGYDLAELLKTDGVSQDLQAVDKAVDLEWIHRSDGERDIYFVSNPSDHDTVVDVRFRVSGKRPELWDPVWGTRDALPEYSGEKDTTLVPMQFAARQSWFVVFTPEKDGKPKSNARNIPTSKAVMEIGGPWQVQFDPKWGGLDKVTFEKLEDWTQRAEEGIKYYSGKALYHKKFNLPQ
jgi:hypothetical protein